MNASEEVDRMISFMGDMDIGAMQDAVQRNIHKVLVGHPKTAYVGLFVEEHPEMCTYIIGYAAAAMGGEMYRTLMDWLMNEKKRLEDDE